MIKIKLTPAQKRFITFFDDLSKEVDGYQIVSNPTHIKDSINMNAQIKTPKGRFVSAWDHLFKLENIGAVKPVKGAESSYMRVEGVKFI